MASSLCGSGNESNMGSGTLHAFTRAATFTKRNRTIAAQFQPLLKRRLPKTTHIQRVVVIGVLFGETDGPGGCLNHQLNQGHLFFLAKQPKRTPLVVVRSTSHLAKGHRRPRTSGPPPRPPDAAPQVRPESRRFRSRSCASSSETRRQPRSKGPTALRGLTPEN